MTIVHVTALSPVQIRDVVCFRGAFDFINEHLVSQGTKYDSTSENSLRTACKVTRAACPLRVRLADPITAKCQVVENDTKRQDHHFEKCVLYLQMTSDSKQ